MKQQVLVIHGGTSFNTHDEYIDFIESRELTLEKLRQPLSWRETLATALGDDYEVLQPKMPNSTNAKYHEWKIWLERCLKLLDEDPILIGQSLGGIFLAKYLSENKLPKSIAATILVAAPFDTTSTVELLQDFTLPDSLIKFEEQSKAIYIMHSGDDPVVPFAETNKYQEALPKAIIISLKDREHIHQESFPELVDIIKSL
jgi:predicted alpha/beta hydrolase family esterase